MADVASLRARLAAPGGPTLVERRCAWLAAVAGSCWDWSWSSEARQRFAGSRGISAVAFLALWLVLPLLLGGLLLARDRTVFAETRYFIFLVPALCLAWGRALAWLTEQTALPG